MALVVRDRVKETTTTVGTGAYLLAGAVTGYQSFSTVGNLNTTYYCATDGTNWEVGIGTYTTSGPGLTRDTILASSNAGSAVSWSAGSKDIFLTYPADKSVYVDGTSITPGSTGILAIANGGTGQTTANAALNALLPSQGGNGGKYLKTNGTSTLWDTSPVGQLYAENPSSPTSPTATGANAVAIGNGSSAASTNAFAFAGGSVASTNSNSIAGGLSAAVSGAGARNLALFGTTSVSDSVAIGNNSASGGATIVGGAGGVALSGSYVNGSDAFAAAIGTNSSTTGAVAASAIAVGLNNYAVSQKDVAIGGQNNAAQGGTSVIVGGSFNQTNGLLSFITGGSNNITNATFSGAMGSYANGDLYGKVAHAAGNFSVVGDAQTGRLVLMRGTTSNTPAVLTAAAGVAGTVNQLILPNNSAQAFTGIIIARQQAAGGSDYAAWEIKGAILRGANAASTTLGSFNINKLSATAGASAWTIGLSADTTNGGLAITATGAAATNIRWVATVQTAEVIYA